MSLEKIDRVKDNPDSPEWDTSEKLLLKAVDELVIDHKISPETHSLLCSFYSVKQIMDVIAIQGMYVILGCMINTWGLELDTHIENKLSGNVTKERFETG